MTRARRLVEHTWSRFVRSPANGFSAVLDKIRPGDLVAHFAHARPGDMTVCAGGFAGDLLDPDDYPRSAAHLSQLVVKCKHIGPGDTIVELAVPPQSRID